VRECDQIKAVLLSSENGSVAQISQAIRKPESTITRYLLDLKNSQKLVPKKGDSRSHLNLRQSEELIQHLADVTYVHTHQITMQFNIVFQK
jgi:DNA-binding IclR family transcriptional regulator